VSEARPVRVVTWNVAWRFAGWAERQTRIAAELGRLDADVVALQEVYTAPDDHQPRRLARALGLDHVAHAFRYRGRDGVSIGNALLSRWPLDDVLDVGVPGPHGRYRTVLAARVRASEAAWTVATTHLAHRRRDARWRRVQVAEVDELVRGHAGDRPAVLLGDLNAQPHDPEMLWLARWGWTDLVASAGLPDDRTWRSDNDHTAGSAFPDRRLDHAWGRGCRATSVRLFAVDTVDGLHASDHAGLLADVRHADACG
jgi:endonuclease/exonuclease/phosphatase family metal-dependent hydrolase